MHFQCLEDLRIDNDKTQAEVAKHLGCQREVYRRYEKSLLSIFPSKKICIPLRSWVVICSLLGRQVK